MPTVLKTFVLVAAAAAFGLAVVVVPTFFGSPPFPSDTLFPHVKAGVEGIGLFGVILLVAGGAALTAVDDRHPVLYGLATIAAFPLFVVLDVAVDSTAHNLWLIELAGYLVLGGFAAGGGLAMRRLRRRLTVGDET